MTNTNEAVRVSQAAREAAGHFVASRSGCESGMQEALRGVHDDTPLVQAFARFEAQAQAELVEALRAIARPTDFASCIGDPWDFYRDLQAIASNALTRIEGEVE